MRPFRYTGSLSASGPYTSYATSDGERAIQTLRVGDRVLAEALKSSKVEAEAVRAVLVDPVSPLIAVDLSDGSAITVTADTPSGWTAACCSKAQAG